MSNILLIEPNYKCKQPPLGLMKISYFHKHILHDYVRFSKGQLPNALSGMKWDHVYVTTLFTYEWDETIKAINYAKTLVDSIDKITVGGIAATILPDDFYKETGIKPVCGLLNEPGKLGLPGDECIDQLVPDYSILDDVDYVYPFNNAYFLSATKGCGQKCGFCAVQTLEPTFIPYIDIKEKIKAIDEEFGPKKDLILMDNNVLRSPRFNEIIDDIIAAGFGKGATYKNPKTGKTVKRYVDFNQGLDAVFLNEKKAKRLGEIALRPARVAFDHIEDKDVYERALRLCADSGITELSNYILYNSEDFGGKGNAYHADTPEDLYDRMRITLDIKDDINSKLPESSEKVAAFSFPMRYIPLTDHKRGYVGSNWNPKFLRAVQSMMVPTQGKGVSSRSFFEADFGKDSSEFVRYLCMPDKLIASRGIISKTSRGKTKETEEEFIIRKKKWRQNQEKIALWNSLYSELGAAQEDFIDLIADNKFLPEKVLRISTELERKLYLLYLTTPRLFVLLGLVEKGSTTYQEVYDFVKCECPNLYLDLLTMLVENDSQQAYLMTNFLSFFGKDGVKDVLEKLSEVDYDVDRAMSKWDTIFKKQGIEYMDWELVRIYRRFVELDALDDEAHRSAQSMIMKMDMSGVASLLEDNYSLFENRVMNSIQKENGKTVLEMVASTISDNIQIKLASIMENSNA